MIGVQDLEGKIFEEIGIPVVHVEIPRRPRERYVCARCKHPWRSHAFRGRQGWLPAVLACLVRGCGCKVDLPSELVKEAGA